MRLFFFLSNSPTQSSSALIASSIACLLSVRLSLKRSSTPPTSLSMSDICSSSALGHQPLEQRDEFLADQGHVHLFDGDLAHLRLDAAARGDVADHHGDGLRLVLGHEA